MRWIIFDMSTSSLPQTAPVWACPECASLTEDQIATHRVPSNLAHPWVQAGRVSLDRIFVEPPPGMATVEDAVTSKDKLGIGCELINGILVAKPMGYYESYIAVLLSHLLYQYLDSH